MPGKRENRRPNPRPAPTFAILFTVNTLNRSSTFFKTFSVRGPRRFFIPPGKYFVEGLGGRATWLLVEKLEIRFGGLRIKTPKNFQMQRYKTCVLFKHSAIKTIK